MPGAEKSTHRDKCTQSNDLLPQESKRYNGAQKFYFTNDAGATKHPDREARKMNLDTALDSAKEIN